jgi:hypothetical protein
MDDTITTDEPAAASQDSAEATDSADFREFILTRELSEVFLLLDNLAADSDTTITALAKLKPPPEGLDADWIERICEIKWPATASQSTQAAQAALVLKAKDYLNGLAKPASGSTIAFTLLFTQRFDEKRTVEIEGAKSARERKLTARRTMAAEAYPEYIPEARRFQGFRRILWVWLCGVLALTCFISWYVAYGNAALGEYATLKTQLEKAQARVDADETGHIVKPEPTESDAGRAGGAADTAPLHHLADAQARTVPEVAYCERWRLLPRPTPPDGLVRYDSPEQRQACRDLAGAKTNLLQGESRLYKWLWVWRSILNVSPAENDASEVASRLTGVLGSAVLPILYGLLGAGAAVLRNVSRKITLSTLSPRDLNLSVLQLGLGAVTGACIGLFIVAPGKDAPLIGPVTLSGSAISFIAGFGVEAVFQALETLIGRVFNLSGVPAQARNDARRGN